MRTQPIFAAGLAVAALAFSAGVAQADPAPDPNDPGNQANWPCGVTVGPVTTTNGTVIGIRGGKPCPPPPPPAPAGQP
ncbi:hypothetical protein [Mycobacterium sp. E342]|uniref:hypothetical protein n=1 Tax=Mycobacterium sp. E342 TaxID=1834147 RepID=UPI000A968EE2|nr:hypothetical protein [Mycobacterium sp. E342]